MSNQPNMVINWPKDSGQRIRNLRRANGMTQERLAEKLNISANHLSKIETGAHTCSLDLYMDISTFFGVGLDYLIYGTEDNYLRLKEKIDAIICELSAISELI